VLLFLADAPSFSRLLAVEALVLFPIRHPIAGAWLLFLTESCPWIFEPRICFAIVPSFRWIYAGDLHIPHSCRQGIALLRILAFLRGCVQPRRERVSRRNGIPPVIRFAYFTDGLFRRFQKSPRTYEFLRAGVPASASCIDPVTMAVPFVEHAPCLRGEYSSERNRHRCGDGIPWLILSAHLVVVMLSTHALLPSKDSDERVVSSWISKVLAWNVAVTTFRIIDLDRDQLRIGPVEI